MDIISHGLWGGIGVGRKNRRTFWLAFIVGMFPDLFSFGVFWVDTLLGIHSRSDWGKAHMNANLIPQYVHSLYNITHSLVVFGLVFAIVRIWRKKPAWILGAWGLHILVDIPTHSREFFSTPFLWPVSNYTFDGISWGNPIIFLPNVALLLIAYSVWILRKRRLKFDTN